MDQLTTLQIIGKQGEFTATRAWLARRFFERLGGLLIHPTLREGEALVIERCNSVHTFFMGYPIDVVFCSADDTVVGVRTNLRPFRIVPPMAGAKYVIELASSEANASIQPGARVVLR